MNSLPNFLYIGTSKAGSTWIFDVLSRHPQSYMVPSKGLYFFDSHYDRGTEWYLDHFRPSRSARVVGEVSHSYLFSLEACQRIAELNPQMKLMVCLREPVERAFSAYLDGMKNGHWSCSFEEALDEVPDIFERSQYGKHLPAYVERFGRERIHIGVFDELAAHPGAFARKLFEFLDVQPQELPPAQQKKMMPAGTPRSKLLTQAAKQVSATAKRMGLKKYAGWAKRSRLVRNLLYRQYTIKDQPRMDPGTRTRLREIFHEDLRKLDELLGSDFRKLWQYN
jgi:hypothetical protein